MPKKRIPQEILAIWYELEEHGIKVSKTKINSLVKCYNDNNRKGCFWVDSFGNVIFEREFKIGCKL